MDWLQSLLWDPSSVAHIVLPLRICSGSRSVFGQDKDIRSIFWASHLFCLPAS